MRCVECGKRVSRGYERCRSCAQKKAWEARRPPEKPKIYLAWRYDCHCGLKAFSFEPHRFIQATCGHDVNRGSRVLYYQGKTYETCPICGGDVGSHHCERGQDETFYIAPCPVEVAVV